jgi:hypothetical protein
MEARLAFAGGGKNSPYKKRCYQYSWKMMDVTLTIRLVSGLPTTQG